LLFYFGGGFQQKSRCFGDLLGPMKAWRLWACTQRRACGMGHRRNVAKMNNPRNLHSMIIDLQGRKAVVTGSTGGIGRAIAEGLARAGAAVVINGRGEARVTQALAEMRGMFPHAEISGVAADVSTAEGAASLIAAAQDADILVNNLGTARPKPFGEITDADWLDLFQFNVMSGVRMTRHHLPRMVARGWGRVVFISSESGVNIPKEMIDYGMTKTAQLAISRGLAESVAGTGVTVNAVLPGPTRSESLMGWMKGIAESQGITIAEAEAQFLKTMRPTSLINRFSTTDEVANMVVYVCSEQASATSGAALRVDGGVVRYVA
jgi:NAD(P)-dependent dehydrogenase (short-subunit alcohol dehydrogenase family)